MRVNTKFAYYCIERWCEHNLEHNGFPSRSPILKFGEESAHISASSIPTGVESKCREEEYAMLVFGLMKAKGGVTAGRVDVLKLIIGRRREDETLQEVCERYSVSLRSYSRALDEFTIILNDNI